LTRERIPHFHFGKCRQLMGQELSSLDFNELGHLEHQLEMSLKSIRTRKVFVRIQMWLVNLASIRTELNEWYIREMKLEIMCNSLGCPDFMSYITRSFMYLQGLIYSDEINELHKKVSRIWLNLFLLMI
jgi:hypothetical protein